MGDNDDKVREVVDYRGNIIGHVVAHKWRWKLLTGWIVVFTLMVAGALWQIQSESANIHSLQTTNCSLKQFIVSAEISRIKSSNADKDPTHRIQDRQSATAYERLGKKIRAVGKCPLPMIPPLMEQKH